MIEVEVGEGERPAIVLRRSEGPISAAWAHLQLLLARGVIGGDRTRLVVRTEVFLAELAGVREARSHFGETVEFGPQIRQQLETLARDRRARERVGDGDVVVTGRTIEPELLRIGFRRKLRPFQLSNLARIASLPHGADFSVPGAGKTTVALANYSLQQARGVIERLLVIGPIASFEAWQEDSFECLPVSPKITLHAGSAGVIARDTQILLTNYNRVAADYERIRDFVSGSRTQVILDEAHRIKRGSSGVHGRAVLDLAYVAARRDVLTGTPAPQGASDLVALVRFLYPGQDRSILPSRAYDEALGRDPDVVRETGDAIRKYFVRTAKSQLGIPNPVWEVVMRPMGTVQAAIYDALLGRYRGSFLLPKESRRDFDRLGRIVMYLLEAATNPALLVAGSDVSDEEGFAHPPIELTGDESLAHLLEAYNAYEEPWKYAYVREAVASAAERGEKVLIWSTFVRNLKALSRDLSAYNPAVIHGGVPSGDSAPTGVPSRESELAKFRSDPTCTVLLANPAAAGEGISLHHWCHHAIFLDRTFNAGHFLQSQDRIHRLGLAPDVVTRFTLLLSEASIDGVVDERLREKVSALALLMDDAGLVAVSLPESDHVHTEPPAERSDFDAIQDHLVEADQ